MPWFIAGIIFLTIGLLWLFFVKPQRVKTKEATYNTEAEYKVQSMKGFAIFPIGLAIIFITLSLFASVGTRSVGVPTVFNKPTGETFDAGLNFKAPWVKVTDIDATIQPEEYFGDRAIKVKIADGGDASVAISYRWRINPDGADQVFQDYRNSDLEINEAVRKALVSTNIKAAINEVFGQYDPLAGADIPPNATPEQIAQTKINVVPDYQVFNKAIADNVAEKIKDVGDLVDIQSITISGVTLPEDTQKRINAVNAAVQNTKIAAQEVATKAQQAAGNRELAASLQDPNVLVSQCLDALTSGKFNAPAGFSCWPGGGNAVVVPSAPNQ